MQSPPATSLAGKDEEIGDKAAQILWRMMNKEPVKYPIFVVQPEIIERESCLGPRPETRS
jgi:DNA-binding LacI/PurR family transcriptional regulator